MPKILKWIDRGVELVLGSFMLIMVAVIFMQVIYRYVLHAALEWSEELTRYMQVYITFLGGAYAVRKRAHIGLDDFAKMLPEKIQKVLGIVVDLVSLGFLGIVLVHGVQIMRIIVYQRTPSLGVPMYLMYAAIPLGALLSIIYLLGRRWDENVPATDSSEL